jgi:hypothetical protein
MATMKVQRVVRSLYDRQHNDGEANMPAEKKPTTPEDQAKAALLCVLCKDNGVVAYYVLTRNAWKPMEKDYWQTWTCPFGHSRVSWQSAQWRY